VFFSTALVVLGTLGVNCEFVDSFGRLLFCRFVRRSLAELYTFRICMEHRYFAVHQSFELLQSDVGLLITVNYMSMIVFNAISTNSYYL